MNDNRNNYINALLMTHLLGIITSIASSRQNNEALFKETSQQVKETVRVLIVVLVAYAIDYYFYDMFLLQISAIYFIIKELLMISLTLEKMNVVVPNYVIKLANKIKDNDPQR